MREKIQFVLKALATRNDEPLDHNTLLDMICLRFHCPRGDAELVVTRMQEMQLMVGTGDEVLGTAYTISQRGKNKAVELLHTAA